MRHHTNLLASGIILSVSGVLAAAFLISCSRLSNRQSSQPPQMMNMPFGDPASVAYSQALWTAMAGARLTGAKARADKPYKGQAPHGAVLETITSALTIGGHKGKVVVKRNYGPQGISIKDVSRNRAKHLMAVTVMFKREKGYDAQNNDWFWVKYKPDGSLHINPKGMKLAGRVAKGMDKGCIACHAAVKDKDYLFGKQK
ncbi:MAG: cytochrome P460 family protein [Methyloligellaceae bacterium]